MTSKSNDEHKSQVQAAQDRRRSNAAGTHADRRTKRNRTRGAQKDAAIREGRESNG